MAENATEPQNDHPDRAGTPPGPVDAVSPEPIGGEATVAASSWGGATDEEMERLQAAETARSTS